MTHQYIELNDTVYFGFVSNDTSGSGVDGTTPLFDVRLGGAAASAIPTLSGTPDLLTHANFGPGAYEIEIAATSGNGFAADSTYLVFVTVTADSQTPGAMVGSFHTGPVTANTIEIGGTAQTANDVGADANTIVTGVADIQGRIPTALVNSRMDSTIDATGFEQGAIDNILDEDMTGHQTTGTLGGAIGDPGANGENIWDAVVGDAAGTNIAADIIVIEAQTDDIGVAGAGLTEAGGTGDQLTAINLPNQTMDISGNITGSLSGSVGSVTGAVGSVTGAVGSVAGNVDGSVASVTADVGITEAAVNLIFDEAMVEPTVVPAITGTFRSAFAWIFALSRNRREQTATLQSLMNDAQDSAPIATASVSDDGTTYVRDEWS